MDTFDQNSSLTDSDIDKICLHLIQSKGCIEDCDFLISQFQKSNRHFLYLSLLACRDVDCPFLKKLIEDDLKVNDLTETSLYNCCCNNKHWLLKLIEKEDECSFYCKICDEIKMKLKMLKIINYLNNNIPINIEEVQSLNVIIPFFKEYFKIVEQAIKISEMSKDKNLSEILELCCKNSTLNVINTCLNLSNLDIHSKVLCSLQNETEKKIFKSFTILNNIINSVRLCKQFSTNNSTLEKDKISSVIEETEQTLLDLNDLKWQVDILEDVFALLFLQTDANQFFCNDREVRLLLSFLKTCICKIQLKHLYNRNLKDVKRISELSKYVTDAFWRFELVAEDCFTHNKNLISKMLVNHETLINQCLKQQNMEKVDQVVKVSSLKKTNCDLAKEISYSEKLQQFKKNFRSQTKNQYSEETKVFHLMDGFFKKYKIEDEIIRLTTILDLAIVQSESQEESEQFLSLLFDSNLENNFCDDFCSELRKIFYIVNDCGRSLSIKDILLCAQFELDSNKCLVELETVSKLCNAMELFTKQFVTNMEKKQLFKYFLYVKKVCSNNEQQVNYFTRLLNYLKALFKIFQLNKEAKQQNLFDLLRQQRGSIVKILICDKKVEPDELEELLPKMKLDVVYHVAMSFFPLVPLRNGYSTNSKLNKLDKTSLNYIQKRNWLLAFLIKKLHGLNSTELEVSKVRIEKLMNLLNLHRVQTIKVVYDNNEALAVLHNVLDAQLIKQLYDREVEKNDIMSSQMSSCSLETGEEMMEGMLRNTDWKYLFHIIESLTERQLNEDVNLQNLRDCILFNLVNDKFESDCYQYVKYIRQDSIRFNCIKNNFMSWPGDFCLEVIENEISNYTNYDWSSFDYEKWRRKILFCEQIKSIIDMSSWYDIHQLCESSGEFVLRQLMSPSKLNLLQQFLDIYKPKEEVLIDICEKYFCKFFTYETNFTKVKEIFEAIPANLAKPLLFNLLNYVRRMDQLEFLISCLKSTEDETSSSDVIQSVEISFKILSCLSESERLNMWCLIREPLCIIEVLVMNTKLEKLGEVIQAIQKNINELSIDEVISWEKIDDLLRLYAEKSLDFRVVVQSNTIVSSIEHKLLESMDSSMFNTTTSDFLMPDEVPDKSDWIKNEEVSECMCCSETTFSMFSRRHHCRRCGRIICGSCSTRRMLVSTYGDIKVRVCKDCYQQTFYDSPSNYSVASVKSIDYDCWQLADNASHNQIVREEFSFEHAPSVYLCLAILKYHSPNEKYTKFLLDQCHNLLRLLYPVPTERTQEVDYFLVIRMLKSLAVAAKMQSFHSGHEGSALADRILSQADLLELLIERGCLHLIPHSSINSQNPFIDTSTIRRLRDKLLEDEQWSLALEVSTKAGLDNTGIFAAWGKSCLKAGSLKWAREKFQRCFDKTSYYENSLEFSCTLNDNLTNKKYSQFSTSSYDNKPNRNPPLLNEIIEILETNSCRLDSKVLKETENVTNGLATSTMSLNSSSNTTLVSSQIDSAVCVSSKLQNLSNIAEGNYGDVFSESKRCNFATNKFFYDECIYYLTRYGSHLGLLEFYIKHDDIETALQYILDCRLSPETFIDVYTICLKGGNVNLLHEKMSKLDSTLDLWKNYLKHICRYFEQQSMLHSLYQLQQFMGDYVRAAMTSIKFYKDGARSYLELQSRVGFLHKAQDHLKQELVQEQWVEVATVRRLNSTSNRHQQHFEAKSITNPSLVMKINSKSVERHINTISRQMELAKFLSECETNGTEVMKVLPDILPFAEKESTEESAISIPTLFGSYYEKVQLAVLCILCGTNVQDGFDIAFKIIEDNKLSPVKVYCQAGKQLAKAERYDGLAQLVHCIRSNGLNDVTITDMCDEMLILAIQTLTKANTTGTQLDGLIKLITDRSAKISAYIETKQLKSAYLLAIKHKRMSDIRRILKEAEYLNQPSIKALCQKVLQANSHIP